MSAARGRASIASLRVISFNSQGAAHRMLLSDALWRRLGQIRPRETGVAHSAAPVIASQGCRESGRAHVDIVARMWASVGLADVVPCRERGLRFAPVSL